MIGNVKPVSVTADQVAFKGLLKNGEDTLRPLNQADLVAPQDKYEGSKKSNKVKKLVVLAAIIAGAVLFAKKFGFGKIKEAVQPLIDKAKGVAKPVIDKAKGVAGKVAE